jgi:N-glycosylase/DNA lyase
MHNSLEIRQLKKIYGTKREEITSRLKEFKRYRFLKSDEEIFEELAFCLLTPQSKAKYCWDAVAVIREENLLLKGTAGQIRRKLHCVRFHNKKALYVVEARKLFMTNGEISLKTLLEQFTDIHECRDWLVKHIKGLGYKEASHFLRNIGLGDELAILDRHILRNLELLGVIPEIPESLSGAKYLKIEEKMSRFAKQIHIPLSHLDLLLWYKETGEIFK